MTTEEERLKGSEILHRTGCKVGQHVWSTLGQAGFLTEPDPRQRCLCGLMEWDEAYLLAPAKKEG